MKFRAVKRLISLDTLIARYFFLSRRSRVNRGFNADFVCYIIQFVCVPFAGECRRPIAVERESILLCRLVAVTA